MRTAFERHETGRFAALVRGTCAVSPAKAAGRGQDALNDLHFILGDERLLVAGFNNSDRHHFMDDTDDGTPLPKNASKPFETDIQGMGRVLITSDNIGDLIRTLPKEDALRLFREACRRDPSPHWNQASDDWIEGAYYMIIMNEV